MVISIYNFLVCSVLTCSKAPDLPECGRLRESVAILFSVADIFLASMYCMSQFFNTKKHGLVTSQSNRGKCTNETRKNADVGQRNDAGQLNDVKKHNGVGHHDDVGQRDDVEQRNN